LKFSSPQFCSLPPVIVALRSSLTSPFPPFSSEFQIFPTVNVFSCRVTDQTPKEFVRIFFPPLFLKSTPSRRTTSSLVKIRSLLITFSFFPLFDKPSTPIFHAPWRTGLQVFARRPTSNLSSSRIIRRNGLQEGQGGCTFPRLNFRKFFFPFSFCPPRGYPGFNRKHTHLPYSAPTKHPPNFSDAPMVFSFPIKAGPPLCSPPSL